VTNAVVTGGAGFIGSHVVAYLVDQGWDVTVVDNLATGDAAKVHPKATLAQASVTDASAMGPLLQNAEYVFHLAALPRIQPSFDDPVGHEEVNVMGTIRCLEAVKGSSRLKKFVLASSSACYGNPDEVPTSESAAISCLSPYALQKYAAEQYTLMLGERFNIPVVSLRYFNVYGPGSFNLKNPFNAYSSVVGVFHEKMKAGQPLSITGDGSQERDFVHVDDVARANYMAATKAPAGSVYNVGSGITASINDLASYFGGPVEHIPERQGEALVTHANVSKITAELGWKPEISMAEGIKLLVG